MTEREKIQAKSLEIIKKENYNGILDLSLRLGKTKIGIDTIDMFLKEHPGSSILWVTTETMLRDVDLPDEFKNFGKESLLKNIDIICYASMKKITRTDDYKLIIMDEIQHITYANSKGIVNARDHFEHILGLTGTVPSGNEKVDLLAALKLEVIHSVTIDEAADKEVVADYNIILHKFKLSTVSNIVRKDSRGNSYMVSEQTMYDRYTWVAKNRPSKFAFLNRMRFLKGLASRKKWVDAQVTEFTEEGKRGLIFLNTKKACEDYELYYHSGVNDKMYQKFKTVDRGCLALVNKGAIGHTYHNLDYCIISSSDSNNMGMTTQRWGRTLIPRKGYTSEVHVFCAEDTVDEDWVQSSLQDVSKNKIKTIYDNI